MTSWLNRFKPDSPEPRVLSAQAAVPAQPTPGHEQGRLPAKTMPAAPDVEDARPVVKHPAANDAIDNGLVVANFVIDSADGFERHGLSIQGLSRASASRAKSFKVHDSLEGKIVPVAVVGAKDICLLLVNGQYRTGPEVEDIAHELKARGWKLHNEYQIVVVGQTLLSSIAQIDFAGNKELDRGKSESKDQLYQVFLHIVKWGFENNAADIDFQVHTNKENSRVGFSINGFWVFPERHAMPTEMLKRVLGAVYQRGSGQAEAALDFKMEQGLNVFLTLDDSQKTMVMLRWASMAGDVIYSVTVRIVETGENEQSVTLGALGYLPDHLEVFNRTLVGDGGAVILTGRVNSGKSTSIDALLSLIPETQKIITIEDPVEKMRPGRISNTVARQLTGEESPILKAKLKNLKRTGFNVLYLGEIRDHETARAAQDVFESGQRLYTTLHAGSAWEIPGRLEGLGLERNVLATPGNLRLLAYQALIPTNCSCAIPLSDLMKGQAGANGEDWTAYASRMDRLFGASLEKVRVRNEQGCPKCRREGLAALNGYRGRTVVAELLEPDEDFCALVSQGDSVGMLHYLRALRGDSAYDSPRMLGKSAFDCAAYKVLTGELDPQSVEMKFESFSARLAKEEARRARAAQTTLRRVGEGVVNG